MGPATVYGSRPVKRYRRTNAELAAIDGAIVKALEDEHPVTLRGVFYRVVAAGAVDKTEAAYKLVGRQLLKLRRAHIVPFSWVTDGTRFVLRPDSFDNLKTMLEDASASYRRALWHKQDVEVMVFTEKDAISGTLHPVTDRFDVPLGVLRGYASETFCYSQAEAIAAAQSIGKKTVVYQFGDHDPWGVEAWQKFIERVSSFVFEMEGFCTATFERLAVTPEQIIELDLPTRPTKKHAKAFRGESVEVDAIPAPILRELAEEAIVKHIDPDAWRYTQMAEESERDLLTRIADSVRVT